MIRFLLNRQAVELADAPADLTALDYLRAHCGKRGTKEGCASGDCGACTVVVATARDGRLDYRAVNSCITYVGALHGKQLLTVEDLADGEALHPVQQAMVAQHGSQCGFCTPGFVMSMFALYKNGAAPGAVSRAMVCDYLGGNLCRCTGYRPIIDAALQAARRVAPDQFSRQADECMARLAAMALQPPRAPRFHHPTSAQQVAALQRRYPSAKLLAGGTDLALQTTQQLQPIDDIIYLGQVAELIAITPAAEVVQSAQSTRHTAAGPDVRPSPATAPAAALEIGAAVPLVDCAAALLAEYPELAELLHRFGSRQVRNHATLGGNIANASPIADLPPALIALGARITLQQDNQLRSMMLENYFIDYKKTALAISEFIRSVTVPPAAPETDGRVQKIRAYKISKRLDDDISAVCAVFNVTLHDTVIEKVCIAFGGMAATPKRAAHSERALLDKTFDADVLTQAQHALREDFQPISDARASADYRIRVAQNLLQRFFIEIFDSKAATRVNDA